jgi:hypothetical protein
MTAYQVELMAVIKYGEPNLTADELQKLALELYDKIKISLDENREKTNKK